MTSLNPAGDACPFSYALAAAGVSQLHYVLFVFIGCTVVIFVCVVLSEWSGQVPFECCPARGAVP